MKHHLFYNIFMSPPNSKEMLLNEINILREFDAKLSSDQIFNCAKHDIKVDTRMTIPKPKIYAKARGQGKDKAFVEKMSKSISEKFIMTVCRC
mmetsp:Transcript_34267/g.39582  ORF Transcript_34267/g.39582 Transcript_34267/m.39582 type:complete len:93 (+) Transcript_34267:2-280(+)